MDARAISWFPLDRISELETELANRLIASRRTARRDAVACALGLSGLRSGEVSQLVLRDLSVPLGRLRVRTLKGGPERVVQLDASVVAAMLDWRGAELVATLSAEDLLLPTCRGGRVRRDQFNAAARRLFDGLLGPLHGLTFHSLRHTFAMRAYAESRDLFLVQRMLGHSSVKTTEIYARSLAELPESCRVKLDARPRLGVVAFEGTG